MAGFGVILRFLVIVALLIAICAGIAGIVNVAQNTTLGSIVQSCDQVKLSGSSCVSNFNAQFAVAMCAAGTCLFSVIALLAEARVGFCIEHFEFFSYAWGRGVWMIFIGLTALGLAGNLGIAAGASASGVGFLLFLYGFCNRDGYADFDD